MVAKAKGSCDLWLWSVFRARILGKWGAFPPRKRVFVGTLSRKNQVTQNSNNYIYLKQRICRIHRSKCFYEKHWTSRLNLLLNFFRKNTKIKSTKWSIFTHFLVKNVRSMACPVQCVQLKVLLNHVRRASREGECTARTHLAWDFSMGEPPIAHP